MFRLPGYGDHLERDNPGSQAEMAELGAPDGFSDTVALLVRSARTRSPERAPLGRDLRGGRRRRRGRDGRVARGDRPRPALRRPLGAHQHRPGPAGRGLHRQPVRAAELDAGAGASGPSHGGRAAGTTSTVRLTASGCGVGSNGPNARWNFDASETKGRSNWYSVSFSSRRNGLNSPAILIIGRDATPIFGGVPGRLEHQLEELPARQRLRGRQVPDLAVGLVALAQRHESAGHVLQVVERVGLVERAQPARPLAAERRLHDVLAGGRAGAARAVVVGGATDRASQPPVGVRAAGPRRPSRCACGPSCPRARCGVSSVIGPSGGPYT